MRRKLLLCLASVGMCAYMLTGCVTNISEEKLPDPKAEQETVVGGEDSSTPGTEGEQASGADVAEQETKSPRKSGAPPRIIV